MRSIRWMAAVLAVTAGVVVGAGPVSGLPGSDELMPVSPIGGSPAGGPGAGSPSVSAAAGEELVGLFTVTAGACTSQATPKGSWFRMVQPGGSAQSGPFVENNDSPCTNKSATPLKPGKDGGLTAGAYQPAPDPAFDSGGNGLATRIVEPARFYGVGFAAATNATDPQTGSGVGAPRLLADGSRLNGDLRAFGVAWNRQHFNQGAPKPNGSSPGQTSAVSGTIDRGTGAFVLEWASQIEGGPFNGFTGVWHFEGVFRSSAVTATGAGSGASGGTGTGSASGSTGGLSAAGRSGAVVATGGGAAQQNTAGAHPRTGQQVPAVAVAVVLLAIAARAGRRVRR